MSKWFQHEEYAAIQAAVQAYRTELDGYQPTNVEIEDAGFDERMVAAAYAGEVLADRIEQALRSTDWRRVEAERSRLVNEDGTTATVADTIFGKEGGGG